MRLTARLIVGILALSLVGCGTTMGAGPASARSSPNAQARVAADAGTGVPGGEAVGGDEPSIVYVDPAGQFNFQHPRSWGKTTPTGESIRYTGRDEFISITIVDTKLSSLDFGRSDASALAAASPEYQAKPLSSYQVAGTGGAMVAFTWQAGPSPVTGKTVPSAGNRYYIPGPAGKLAIFTYSSPVQLYDPAGADDFANAFKWLK